MIGDVDASARAEAVAAAAHDGLAIEAVELDVTSPDAAAEATARLQRTHGGVAALVNNAGIVRDAPLTKMSDADFRAVVEVCLFGAFNMSRAVVPAMASRGHGRIVNMASRAYLGNPGQANYSAAKAGIVGLTKALAKELGRAGITVNAIAPGLIDTALIREHPKYEAIVATAAAANSVPRIGQPEDVAAAVAFLVSDAAAFITGEVIHVSGGRFS